MRRLLRPFQQASEETPDHAGDPASDLALVAAARNDPAAFDAIFDRYFDDVFRYCFYRIGDWHEAEDAASQVFLTALGSLDRFARTDNEDSFRSWIFGIARNVVGKSWRYSERHPSTPLDEAAMLPDSASTIEERVLNAELTRQLHDVMTQLTPDQRELLELRLSGLTAVEIARVLGRSQESIRKAQSRAVMTLRELLGDDAGVPNGARHG